VLLHGEVATLPQRRGVLEVPVLYADPLKPAASEASKHLAERLNQRAHAERQRSGKRLPRHR
jgi:hypothetical protein